MSVELIKLNVVTLPVRISIFFPFYFVCSVGFSIGNNDSLASYYASTITKDELSKHLHIISSDEYEGRETGEPGQKKAAEYIANQYRSYGLDTISGMDSYFQAFPLIKRKPLGAKINIDDKEYKLFEDFYYFPGFDDIETQADEVVFLGFGISEKDYDDYQNIDVAGKIVVILNGEPKSKKGTYYASGEKRRSSWSVSWRKKLELANEKGARAVLIVVNDLKKNMLFATHFFEEPGMKLNTGKEKNRIPNLYISVGMANTMLKNTGKNTISSLKRGIEKKGKPNSFAFKTKINLKVFSKESKFESENVLGYIEGTDLKDEHIILTAHYDHIGKRDSLVYNGADDDGSGTVSLLEIAQAFAEAKKNGHGPRRSVLIMPVSGEEKGLLGSQYYVENPVLPLENAVADLNIDMIGRIDSLHDPEKEYVYLIGSNILSTELHEVSEEVNSKHTGIDLDYTYNTLDDPNRFYYRSDHYNFAQNNVPVIFYFSGIHKDYHQPTDTVDKIKFDRIEKIARLVFLTAWELANRDERIKLRSLKEE